MLNLFLESGICIGYLSSYMDGNYTFLESYELLFKDELTDISSETEDSVKIIQEDPRSFNFTNFIDDDLRCDEEEAKWIDFGKIECSIAIEMEDGKYQEIIKKIVKDKGSPIDQLCPFVLNEQDLEELVKYKNHNFIFNINSIGNPIYASLIKKVKVLRDGTGKNSLDYTSIEQGLNNLIMEIDQENNCYRIKLLDYQKQNFEIKKCNLLISVVINDKIYFDCCDYDELLLKNFNGEYITNRTSLGDFDKIATVHDEFYIYFDLFGEYNVFLLHKYIRVLKLATVQDLLDYVKILESKPLKKLFFGCEYVNGIISNNNSSIMYYLNSGNLY